MGTPDHNLSTDHQLPGDAKRPSDTLDRGQTQGEKGSPAKGARQMGEDGEAPADPGFATNGGMTMAESDMQRSNGEPEAVRRQDGGGETSPLPGSEAARGNAQPANAPTGTGEAESWTPGKGGDGGIRPGSPADAALAGTAPADAPEEPDSDPQAGGGRMPEPGTDRPKPDTGADASSHGSR